MATEISKDPFYQTFASIVCKKKKKKNREREREDEKNFPIDIYKTRREVQQVGKFMRKEKRNENTRYSKWLLLPFNAIRKIEDRISDNGYIDFWHETIVTSEKCNEIRNCYAY